MTYCIEKSRNINLEDTAIPNIFITDFMPDVPDGDFVKVYVYAYMCCRYGIALTHTELAARLGLELQTVLSAWRYYSDRRIVKLWQTTPSDDTHFDVEFMDVKGMLYVKEKPHSPPPTLSNPAIATLFQKLALICGAPSIDGADAKRIMSWIEEDGATPEIIEYAYQVCREEYGEKGAKYKEKMVKEWAGKGLKTVGDVRGYRAEIDARSAVHKKLMEALGLRYAVITTAEEKTFNLWLDEYGYTPERLLELADKTEGVSNKLKYLGGIIRKEREAAGLSTKPGTGGTVKAKREEYYRKARQKNKDKRDAHFEEVYSASPAIKSADDEITALNFDLVKTLTDRNMTDKEGAVKRIQKDIEAALTERKKLLREAGFPTDYTDEKYDCVRCRDTGILENGASCDCYTI